MKKNHRSHWKKCSTISESPEVFYKKRCSGKFSKIHRKTPVAEPLFLEACNFIEKETLAQGVFLRILLNFPEHLFYRTPPDDCFWSSEGNTLINIFHWYSSCLCELKKKTQRINKYLQKQPFAEILQDKCTWKFRNFHRKTPVNTAKYLRTAF